MGTKRATIYFDQDLHRTLKLKAATTDHSISELVNEAVRYSLAEDAEDIESFKVRESDPLISFEDVLKGLKNSGKL
jgi:hypothetical protein